MKQVEDLQAEIAALKAEAEHRAMPPVRAYNQANRGYPPNDSFPPNFAPMEHQPMMDRPQHRDRDAFDLGRTRKRPYDMGQDEDVL